MPDLILLDVMMPEMDGFETCARLKADARTRDSAVIFLSALTEPSEKVRGLELGAVDFVNKPFQAEEVLARVRTHLTIRDLQKQLRRRNEELEHELTVAQELLREARDRTDGVLLGDSAVGRAPSAGHSGGGEVRRHACSSAGRLAATTRPSPAPCIINRARASRAIICVNCLSVRSRLLAIVRQDRREPGRPGQAAPGRRRHALPGRHPASAPGIAADARRATSRPGRGAPRRGQLRRPMCA